jgi:hypothetical protein
MFHTSNISRTDVFCTATALLLLICLLLPALARSNSEADKTFCLKQMKDIAILVWKYEDTVGRFPLASTRPIDHKPGSLEAESEAG